MCEALAFVALLAQHSPAQTEPETIEPAELEHMLRQSDPEMKLLLLDRFWKDYQTTGLIHWAFDEICRGFEAAGQPAGALAAGEKLLVRDPQDVEVAQKSLKIAEDQKDAALIEKWSAIAARAAGASGALHDHLDYLAYSAITRIADTGRKREAIEQFLKSHKGSPYQTAAEDLYLQSWRESGDSQGTLAAARRILQQDDSNLTALAIVADSYLQSEKEPQKLMACARKILAVVEKQPKQEGLTAAEWSRKKAPLIGHAYWMIGTVSMQQDRYSDADKSIRTALPYLKDDSRLLSTALFYLGWANYHLGNLPDALRFNQQCTLVKGPYQAQAAKSVRVISAQIASQN
jgi:tetratricopeptide (TPR) repeat protein